MQVMQINRADAEKVLVAFKNVDGGGSITTGLGVSWVQAGASIDGISAVRMLAANYEGFIGVSTSDVAINSYGLAVAWGFANSVLLSHVGTSITVTRGDVLKPGATGVAGGFFSSLAEEAISTLLYRYVIAATTPVAISTKAQSYCSGLVRAL